MAWIVVVQSTDDFEQLHEFMSGIGVIKGDESGTKIGAGKEGLQQMGQ